MFFIKMDILWHSFILMEALLDISFLCFRGESKKDFKSDSRKESPTNFTSKFVNSCFPDFLDGMIGD